MLSHRSLLPLSCTLLLLLFLPTRSADAADVWTNVAPGIDRLVRTAAGPHVVHAVIVDLSHPGTSLRATRDGENGRTTTSFSNLVGATVAINGDWFTYGSYQPRGLAVGGGSHWASTADLFDHSFLACTLEKGCQIDLSGQAQSLYWRWWNVVGGNGAALVQDGAPLLRSESFYSSDRHPRSAVGIDDATQTLILVVVQGRRSDSIGMTFNEVANLLVELGADDGMMLDGGGSSTLVVGGARVNALESGTSERVVANHLAVVVSPVDPACAAVPNGRTCLDATWISTCEGGQHQGDGDCGFFGATCEEHEGTAYCVALQCHNGGNAPTCLDATVIGQCEWGRVESQGDCAVYGATCEEAEDTAFCVHYRCEAGGMGAFCDGDVAVQCDFGVPTDVDCAADGLSCDEGACVEPVEDPTPPDDPTPPEEPPTGELDRPDGELDSLYEPVGCALHAAPGSSGLLLLVLAIWGRRARLRLRST